MPMLDDATKTLKSGVGARPVEQPRRDCGDNVVQIREIAIVKTTAADQLPDAFDRIEFGAVRRQEMKTEMSRNVFAPLLVEDGVVVTCVVDNHDNCPGRAAADSFDLLEEIPASIGVEHALGSGHNQFAISESHRTEIADALSGWGVQADGIGHFRRNPHSTARSMLLKMHFIHRPQIEITLARQDAEFFYARFAIQDWIWRPVAGVCAAENPTVETIADTDEPSASLHAFGQDTPIASVHPTSESVVQIWLDWTVTQPPLVRFGDRSAERVAQIAAPRTSQPSRESQNAAPSLRLTEGNHPTIGRLPGKSFRGPPTRLHEADGRSVKCHCVGSRLGEP